MQKLETITNQEQMLKLLVTCKEHIMRLPFPQNDKGTAMKETLINFGIPEKDVMTKGWTSMKKVLASKYNERALIATRKVGVALKDIRMAVLIQKV